MNPRLAGLLIPLLFTVVLLSAVYAVSRTRATEITALSLAIPAVVLQGWHTWRGGEGLAIAGHILGILSLGYAIVIILKALFRSRRVTADMICASLCVYLLAGILCAMVYSSLFFLDPTTFAFSFADENSDYKLKVYVDCRDHTYLESLIKRELRSLGYIEIKPDDKAVIIVTVLLIEDKIGGRIVGYSAHVLPETRFDLIYAMVRLKADNYEKADEIDARLEGYTRRLDSVLFTDSKLDNLAKRIVADLDVEVLEDSHRQIKEIYGIK